MVGKVNPQAKGWFQEIEVEPSVDVFRLENVLVLIPDKSAVTDLENILTEESLLPSPDIAIPAAAALAAESNG